MTDEFNKELIGLLPNLRRFAISLCKSPVLADDLVQATCEKALAHRDRFQHGTRMDAWLFRIMRNGWIDLTRRKKTGGVTVEISDQSDILGHDGARESEHRLMLGAVGEAIAKLPDDQREVLLLVCVEDLSYREAAEVLGVPIGTVMSRLARSRIKLVEQLGINEAQNRSANRKGPER